MKGEIKHLANNERYRMLIIEGKTYIMDIENSFLKIIFPFLFWLFPNPVYRVEDQIIVEQLQTEKMKRKKVDSMTAGLGFSYAGGMALVPLADYFDIPMTPLTKTLVMVFSIILVGLLYFHLSRKAQKTMSSVVNLETLTIEKLRIRPSSIKHFSFVVFSYIVLILFVCFWFLSYMSFGNILILIVASATIYLFLITNRKTIREGVATMIIIKDK